MNADTFRRLAEGLTGNPVKDITETNRSCLGTLLADDTRPIDCSQLNELLLLVNKDRVTECFFNYFFGKNCRVATLQAGVEKFQKTAMLRFGNFIHAFRTLARIRRLERFANAWHTHNDAGTTP